MKTLPTTRSIAALMVLVIALSALPMIATAQDSTPGAAEAAALPGPAEQSPQPSYDTLRVVEGTAALPYHVWID